MAQKGGGKASRFARSLERGGASAARELAPEAEEAPQKTEQPPAPEPGRASRSSRGRQRPEKPVRITVDLDADRHRFLRRYAADEGVRGTEVVRGLLTLLEDDPELAERLSQQLAEGGQR